MLGNFLIRLCFLERMTIFILQNTDWQDPIAVRSLHFIGQVSLLHWDASLYHPPYFIHGKRKGHVKQLARVTLLPIQRTVHWTVAWNHTKYIEALRMFIEVWKRKRNKKIIVKYQHYLFLIGAIRCHERSQNVYTWRILIKCSLNDLHKMNAYRAGHGCPHDSTQEPIDRFRINLV